MNYLYIILSFVLISNCSYCQSTFFDEYAMSDKVTPWTLPDSLNDELAILLKNHKIFSIDSEEESENSLLYIEHRHIYINSDKAIEDNNKIYTVKNSNGAHNITARVIQPDGKIVFLDESNIKTGVSEDSGYEYSYYAVDGLVIGSELETLTKIRTVPNIYGQIIYIQEAYKQLDFLFKYTYPTFLEFAFKVYNSNIKGSIEKTEELNTYTLRYDYVDAKRGESMSLGDSDKTYLIYKLDKNFYKGLKDINSFGIFSQQLADRIFNININKSDNKKIDKIIEQSGANKADTDSEKVLAIESYIKTNFVFEDSNLDELNDLSYILKNNAFNSLGALQLFNILYDRLGFTCSAVGTVNKSRMSFDKNFENYLFISKYLLFIKEINTVIDPTDPISRLDFFDTDYAGQNGLFVTPKVVGGISTAIGRVKAIPETEADDNLTYMNIVVDASESFEELNINVEKSVYGNVAISFQPLFPDVPEEMKEEFYTYVLYTHADDFIYETVEFENIKSGDFPSKPLKQRYAINGDNYWEKAGKNYIFKLGKLIGPQSQLYHDDHADRQYDVSSPFARRYTYDIEIKLPQGYSIANVEDINHIVTEDIEGVDFYFKSTYELSDDILTVKIDELYDRSTYPSSYFEDYRKVVNAAADFNKINLVFKAN